MLEPEKAKSVGQIIDEEIDKAFAEGFKQGVIEWKPEAVKWKAHAQSQDESVFWNGFTWGFCSGGIIVIVGGAVVVGLLHGSH